MLSLFSSLGRTLLGCLPLLLCFSLLGRATNGLAACNNLFLLFLTSFFIKPEMDTWLFLSSSFCSLFPLLLLASTIGQGQGTKLRCFLTELIGDDLIGRRSDPGWFSCGAGATNAVRLDRLVAVDSNRSWLGWRGCIVVVGVSRRFGRWLVDDTFPSSSGMVKRMRCESVEVCYAVVELGVLIGWWWL